MIRINLLSEGRRPVVARRTRAKLGLGDQDPSAYILLAGILLGLLAAGVWWFILNSEIKRNDDEIVEKKREVERLRPIIEEVEEYKARKADREQKIEIINDLKRKQQGPVHIMDQVSKALPELLWLEAMTVQGTSVNLRGKAFNTNAVAAFVENLDRVPDFREPNLKDVQVNRARSYDFQINYIFDPLLPEPEEEAEVEDAAAASGES